MFLLYIRVYVFMISFYYLKELIPCLNHIYEICFCHFLHDADHLTPAQQGLYVFMIYVLFFKHVFESHRSPDHICCSLLQSVAVCCSLLQSVAVCCSMSITCIIQTTPDVLINPYLNYV